VTGANHQVPPSFEVDRNGLRMLASSFSVLANSPRGCTPPESCPARHEQVASRSRLYAKHCSVKIELASDLNPRAVIVSLSWPQSGKDQGEWNQ
jgi:hypothetical protein